MGSALSVGKSLSSAALLFTANEYTILSEDAL
jgi:hypothetical protein